MADRLEIVDALESLVVHCRLPLLDVEARSRWMQTWCEDLKDFPVDAIREACRRWRQSENTKFPTPGQLLPIIRGSIPKPATAAVNNEPWSWPSEAALAAMPLAEQRRSHLIMAHVSRAKAGPMGATGAHLEPDWLVHAARHEAEAKRIDRVMVQASQQREEAP